MKVWIVLDVVDFEGESVIDVFSSESAARAYVSAPTEPVMGELQVVEYDVKD